MKIGAVAELAGLTTKAIRYYESIGLLAEPVRTASGYRDYGPEALERLRFVRDAQASGLTLAEITSVLELKDAGSTSCQHTTALIERHLHDVDQQIERLQQARMELAAMAKRAKTLDPASCSDPNRCQIIAETDSAE